MRLRYYILTGITLTLIIVLLTGIQMIFYGSFRLSESSSLHKEGFEIRCDENFLQPPSKCNIADKAGNTIPNKKLIELLSAKCYFINEYDYVMPCRMS